MARRASQHPTELELEILKVLWQRGPSSVRQVREALAPTRDLAHTSVMTIMHIMTRKKYLRRSKQTGAHVYVPRLTFQSASKSMMRDLIDRLFGGSVAAATLQLLQTGDIDAQELDEIRKLLRRKSKG
jgi:predicted transcriptional regulator